jgi:hypothetical protein
MPITEGLMKVGNWDIELVDDAPTEVRRAFRYGANIFVTPTHIIDPDISVTNLAALAVFGGLTFRKGNQLRKFGGPGMLGYIQTGKGRSLWSSSVSGTFTTLITALFDGTIDANGLGTGTSFSPTATGVTFLATNVDPAKSILDDMALQSGNEYRCLPTGLVDYGIATSLFRSTPTVVVSPDLKGRDSAYVAVDVTEWDYDEDIDNYRNKASGTSASGGYGSTQLHSSPAGYVTFLHWGSTSTDALYYNMGITTTDTNTSAEVDRIMTATADRYVTPNFTIRCTVKDFCVPRLIVCGDWVYVYSALDDLKDAANQIHVLGQIINPKKMRVTGYTYPIEQGMGVYAYYYSASGTGITDVTDFVKWEQPGASLEIETKRPSVVGGRSRSIID